MHVDARSATFNRLARDQHQNAFKNIEDLTGRVEKLEPYCFTYGGFADIWKGELTETDGSVKRVAIKAFREGARSPKDLNNHIDNYINAMLKIRSTTQHANISSVFGISLDFHRPSTPCIVLPYFKNGDVIKYLENNPIVDKLALVTQMASAVSHIHGLDVVHGNLCPGNILISDKGAAVLADVGLNARLFNPATTDGWRFKAPELMVTYLGEESSIPHVTKETDIYGFASVAYYILTGLRPFSRIKSDANVILSVVAGIRPQKHNCLNDEIWTTMERCWDFEPNLRPSMDVLCLFFELRSTVLTRL
jgi:serine/threonine protein kinase